MTDTHPYTPSLAEFYERHYSDTGWTVEVLTLRVYVPTTMPGESLDLVQSALADAGFDIRAEAIDLAAVRQEEREKARAEVLREAAERFDHGRPSTDPPSRPTRLLRQWADQIEKEN